MYNILGWKESFYCFCYFDFSLFDINFIFKLVFLISQGWKIRTIFYYFLVPEFWNFIQPE